MDSVSSLSSSYVNDLRGYGGLASGLDRDTLIESMTYGTELKIQAQEQKKQLLEWEQEAIQGITSSMYEFGLKYTSFSSSSNLLSSTLFSRTDVTAVGENSKYLSVSGTAASSQTLSVLAVKSLAQDAQMSSTKNVSDRQILTNAFSTDMGTEIELSNLVNKSFQIQYGETNYRVSLPDGEDYDYTTAESAAASINKAMSEVEVAGGKTLDEVVKFEVNSSGEMVLKNLDTAGNKVMIGSGSEDVLTTLGILESGDKISDMEDSEKRISSSGMVGTGGPDLMRTADLAEQFSGAVFKFDYNGQAGTITLGEYDADTAFTEIMADMQKGLDDAFGYGRVQAEAVSGADSTVSLSFKTTSPVYDDSTGTFELVADESSVLTLTGATSGFLGDSGVFGVVAGDSNRLNLHESMADSGLARVGGSGSDPMTIKNAAGDEIDLTELGLTWDSSVQDIIDKINETDEIGIKIAYQANSDSFVVTSDEKGASGAIVLSGTVADALFGTAGTDYQVEQGKDAVILVEYAGSTSPMEITRSTNTISVDGLNITVKDTFGVDESGTYIADTEAVTFTAEVDVDATTEIVKEMIDEYNKMLEEIGDLSSEMPDNDFQPLTDDERDGLSESEIEKWETEAKKGLLFNDTDMRSLMDSLRFVLPSSMYDEFKEIGITVSTDYEDNGKLVFDESAFKAALSEDPDNVKDLINGDGAVQADGTVEPTGLLTNINNTIERYAGMTGATKGILVERAGSKYSPATLISDANALSRDIDDIDDVIERLQDTLQTETDRYIAQFTTLETLISQMNSQSSYLASMFSY